MPTTSAKLKRRLGKFLRKLQGVSLYKRIARSLSAKNSAIDICIQKEESPYFTATTFVAQKKNTQVGSVQLVRYPAQGVYTGYWLFGLSVKMFYRRLGIGERLTRAVLAKAQKDGAKELSLLVAEDNSQAIKLYGKLGFCLRTVPALEEELKKEKVLLGYRRVAMCKDLNANGVY